MIGYYTILQISLLYNFIYVYIAVASVNPLVCLVTIALRAFEIFSVFEFFILLVYIQFFCKVIGSF